jgi:serine protease inhibitor
MRNIFASPAPQVDEAGTEAAAVTAVMMLKSALIREPPTLFLKFDRPFAFAVVHHGTGAALFAGELRQPEAWGGDEAA